MFSKIKLQVRPNLVLFINWGTPFLAYRSNRCLVCNKSTIYRQSVLTKSTGIPSLIYFQCTDLSFLYLDQTYNSTFYGGKVVLSLLKVGNFILYYQPLILWLVITKIKDVLTRQLLTLRQGFYDILCQVCTHL